MNTTLNLSTHPVALNLPKFVWVKLILAALAVKAMLVQLAPCPVQVVARAAAL
jgi:hypothetical protein